MELIPVDNAVRMVFGHDMLSDSEWLKVKPGEADIEFAWVVPDEGWPERVAHIPAQEPATPAEKTKVLKNVAGALNLDTERMSLEQINLMPAQLPVDLTCVDETDRVAYYSDGQERISPCSPAIIGREVR